MKDKDEHFWIDDVINRLPSGLIPESKDWSSVLSALTKLKTERNNAIAERNELAAQVERLRGALSELESACKYCADTHGLDVYSDLCEAAGNACSVLDETPSQSLEAVKRELRRKTLDDVAYAVRYEFEGSFSPDAFDDFIESMP